MWRWLDRHADHTPRKTALRFEGREITYRALAAAVERAAAALAARGVGRGDRVAFFGHNDPAQIVQLFALARLGAVQVPLNWRLAPPELRFILEDSGATLLASTPAFLATAREVAPPGCDAFDAVAVVPDARASAVGTDDDPILLVYTSGTTGRPKGAMLDQRAMLYNALNAMHLFALGPADHVLTVLPLFHVGGLNIQAVPALYAGATVTLHPRFEPAAFLEACAREQPTLSLVVPAVMQALVAHPGWAAADLSSLRAVGAGSSDVPVPLIEAFHAHGVPVQQVYGCTETAPIAIGQTRDEALAAPGSIGRPVLHSEARVVDEEGRPLPAGATGQMEIRGPHVMRGYWREAKPALRGGWFATGDVGRVDPEGRWWFTDRLTHVIISGGENVYPAEVERVLRTSPGILEGAVCGRPDERWGQVPVAVVVPDEDFSREAVLAYFEGRIARFKQPRDVITVDELPKTALGKVQLGALRALVAGGGTVPPGG